MVGHSKQLLLTTLDRLRCMILESFLLFLILSDVLGEDMSRHIMHKNSIINSDMNVKKRNRLELIHK